MKSVLSFATIVASSVVLIACAGDEITEVTAQYTSGAKILKADEPMPECSTQNEGAMVYSAELTKLYYCNEGEWRTLDGAKGNAGGACKAEYVLSSDSSKSGVVISCDDFLDTLWNGEKGEMGDALEGCSILPAADSSKRTGLEVKCGDSEPTYIWNDEDGNAGCNVETTTDKKTKKTGVKVTCGDSDPVYVWDAEKPASSSSKAKSSSSKAKSSSSSKAKSSSSSSQKSTEPAKDESSSSSEEVVSGEDPIIQPPG